jgi:hypothetical protein
MERTANFWHLAGFTPKQLEAIRVVERFQYVLFGGTRGPGKSYWLRWLLLYIVLELKACGILNPTVGLFCEDYPILRDRQIKRIKEEFPRSLGVVKSTQEEGLGFHLHSGGMIALRNLDDPSKYQGAEFAAVGIDEITKSEQEAFNLLRGSLRWPGVDAPKLLTTGNPGGIGHAWVKQLWIDGDFPEEYIEAGLGEQFAYVKGTPYDNPHLPAGYWQMLRSLPLALRRAWLQGDWDVFEGQCFDEWRTERHVCRPFEIPERWTRWRCVDWGYAEPFACYWLAEDPNTVSRDGRHRRYVYREAYAKGLTDPDQADLIREMSGQPVLQPEIELPREGPRPLGEYVGGLGRLVIPGREMEGGEEFEVTVADPSMWTQRSTRRETESTADVYEKHGIPLTKADNSRISGKRRVHQWLAWDDAEGELLYPDGKPGLQVFDTCRNLIRTLPALPYDESRPEDVDKKSEDHAYDALRYGLAWDLAGERDEPTHDDDYWAKAR